MASFLGVHASSQTTALSQCISNRQLALPHVQFSLKNSSLGNDNNGKRWSVELKCRRRSVNHTYHENKLSNRVVASVEEGDPCSRATSEWSSDKVLDVYGEDIPTQAEAITSGGIGASVLQESRPADVDYLQELLAIQQQGPRAIGFFGTRNMGFMHQQLIEILSYAMVITNNHIYTSGASGTNAAVIRGALRAERPDLLTVILPQSLKMQPPESQELLTKVTNVKDMPHNDNLPLIEASRLCNMDIVSCVQQVICFAFHDSRLLMETCREAKAMRKIVTLFYLD